MSVTLVLMKTWLGLSIVEVEFIFVSGGAGCCACQDTLL